MPELTEDLHSFIESGIRPVTIDDVKARSGRHQVRLNRPRARVLMTGAMALAAITVVLIATVILPSGSPGGPTSAAAAELEILATRAATIPSNLSAGQYAYTEFQQPTLTSDGSTIQGGPNYTEYLVGTVQTWVAADGSGRRVTTTNPTPRFYTAADRAAWIASGSPPAVIPPSQLTTVQTFGPGTGSEVNGPIPIYDVSGLPTDPSALVQILNNENPGAQSLGTLPTGIKSLDYVSSCSSAACSLFERAVALLQGPDVGDSPAFRQALFQVLATVPGVKLLGTIADQADQSGVGLALVEHQAAGNVTDNCATQSPSNSSTTVITKSVTTHQPASSQTFSIVVDPHTTTLLSSERSFSPSVVTTIPNPCGPPALQNPQTSELPPSWSDVVDSGVVNTDSAVPSPAST
jgi:hypothetical protein